MLSGSRAFPAKFFHAFFTIRSHIFQRYFRFVQYAEGTKTKDPHAPQGCAERRFSICLKYSTTTNLHRNPASSPPIPTRTASSSRSTRSSSRLPHSRSRPAPVPEQKKKSGKAGKIVALLLACALVGGGSGFGAAALMQKTRQPSRRARRRPPPMRPVMLEAKRQAAALQVASVDTGKVLTPSESMRRT